MVNNKKNLLAIKQVETTEIVVVVTPAAVVVVADDDEALTKPETSLDD
jgi:intracellular sulfur oxidation DsrE/DsrF family protein